MKLSFYALLCLIYPDFVRGNNKHLIEPNISIRQKCIPIPYTLCHDMGYNMTSLPNLIGLELQSEAEYSLLTFQALIKYGCSSQLLFFLCSLYAPMCSPEVSSLIGPCRPLCEGVKKRCSPVLAGFGFPWPSFLNCSVLPSKNKEGQMCMDGPLETVPLPPPLPLNPSPHDGDKCAHYIRPQLHVFINASGVCSPICGAHVHFSREDKTFAAVWMAIWSVAAFCVCIFVVLSFLLKSSIFKYPERSAVYICLCYAFVASGYFVRLAVGERSVSCHKDPGLGIDVSITEGTLSTTCAVVFLLLYYFSMGAGVWWVILGVTWMLKAWKGFSHEQILRLSSWLHALGWGSPAVLTIFCLLQQKVDSDELTGICFVGGHNSENLLKWVIVPQFIFIIVGTTLVFIVFACFWRARSALPKMGLSFSHIDVAAARVGIQALLFLIPATFLVGVSFYEIMGRQKWHRDLTSSPSVEVLMLKIFMKLATGLLLGLFLINAVVLDTWRRFWNRLIHSRRTPLYLRNPALIKVSKDPIKGHIKVQLPQDSGAVLALEKAAPSMKKIKKSGRSGVHV